MSPALVLLFSLALLVPVMSHNIIATPSVVCDPVAGQEIRWSLQNDWQPNSCTLTMSTATSAGPVGTVLHFARNGQSGDTVVLFTSISVTHVGGDALWTDGTAINGWGWDFTGPIPTCNVQPTTSSTSAAAAATSTSTSAASVAATTSASTTAASVSQASSTTAASNSASTASAAASQASSTSGAASTTSSSSSASVTTDSGASSSSSSSSSTSTSTTGNGTVDIPPASGHDNVGVIVGGVAGGLVGLGLLAAGAFFAFRAWSTASLASASPLSPANGMNANNPTYADPNADGINPLFNPHTQV